MKQAIIDLSDDFEKGYCSECPFCYEREIIYDDDGYIEYDYSQECVFGYGFEHCILNVVEV